MKRMHLPLFWRNWQEIRKLWWVQALYLVGLLGSYALFAYVLSYIWLVETPSLLQIFLVTIGSFLGVTAIVVSCLDCILLCCRRSARVQTLVAEPIIVEPILVPPPLLRGNPMLLPVGRGARAEKIEMNSREILKQPPHTYEP